MVHIPSKTEESSGNLETSTEKAVTLSGPTTSPDSAPSTLGGRGSGKPAAWEGLNWSRTSSKTGHHSLYRSRSMSETSMSSSYSETSRSSVDLYEELNAKEVIVPTIARLPPNIITEVAAHNSTGNMSAAVNNPFQSRPPAESTSHSWFRFSGHNNSSARIGPRGDWSTTTAATSNHNNHLPRQTRGHQTSMRSLLFLFLIAVYTTFGLTVHNLPVAPELEFAGVNIIYPTTATATATISADFLTEPAEALPSAEVTTATTTIDGATEGGSSAASTTNVKKKYDIKSQIAFARRAKQKLFFRPKEVEVKDFYQQQALVEEVDYSFFVNCGVLALVVCWAWRERRGMSHASSLPGVDEDPDMLV